MGALLDGRRRLIARFGQPMTLIRGATSAACSGVLSAFKPEQLVGELRHGDARLELLAEDLAAAGFPVPPRNPDEVQPDAGGSYTVLFAHPVMEGAALIGWSCTVRGS